MKKFKVIKKHYLLKKGTVVIDTGLNEDETEATGKEHRNVLIEDNIIPITYVIPLDKLEEVQ